MATVIGLGGVFIKTKDPKALAHWYQEALGVTLDDSGVAHFIHSETDAAFGPGARTIWSAFQADTDYFAPSGFDVMINFIVDDVEAVLARARAAGAETVGDIQRLEYGDFGWVMDPDGRKIELWRPALMGAGEAGGAQGDDA